ncbi:MAG: hypothetical protein LUG93_07955 [Lachnospiraceae bacterium]|nr:hypothetical protein [Lachnospiraceae bacterium]
MAVEPLSLQTVFYQDDVAGHELVEIIYRLIRRHKAPWSVLHRFLMQDVGLAIAL